MLEASLGSQIETHFKLITFIVYFVLAFVVLVIIRLKFKGLFYRGEEIIECIVSLAWPLAIIGYLISLAYLFACWLAERIRLHLYKDK